jgi:hypothetical protein
VALRNADERGRVRSGSVSLVHAIWYFARIKNAFPSNAMAAKAVTAKHYGFRYQGDLEQFRGNHPGAGVR